jgi:hypothetical protein
MILVINCFLSVCYGQFHERIYFNNLYNQNTWSAAISIIEYNNSYIVSGVVGDSIMGYKNIAIVTLSLEGELLSWKEFRFNNSDHYAGLPGSLHNYNDSAFLLCGSNSVGNESCGLFMNFDSTFDKCQYYTYCSNIEKFLLFQNCNIIDDSNIIFTGYERQMNATGDVFLLKCKNNGSEYWRTHYGFETVSEGQKVLETSDSDLLISGYTYSPSYSYSGNALIIKTNDHGYMEWYRTPGNPNYQDGYGSVTIAPDGNYVFGYAHAVYQGPPYPVPESFCKIKFIKYGQNGDTIWERLYGQAWQVNMLRNIITLHDGSFLAVGYANSDTINGVFQGWLFKINQFGDSIWYRDYRHYPSSSLDYLYDVYETSDHSIIACGVSSYAEPGPDAVQRMWVLKLDSAGCAEPGCDPTVEVTEAWGHGGVVLWPNPASGGVLNVKCLGLSEVGSWELIVYDIFGRAAPIPGPRQWAGRLFPTRGKGGSWILDISSLPSGIYFISVIKDGNRVAGGKFVVAR